MKKNILIICIVITIFTISCKKNVDNVCNVCDPIKELSWLSELIKNLEIETSQADCITIPNTIENGVYMTIYKAIIKDTKKRKKIYAIIVSYPLSSFEFEDSIMEIYFNCFGETLYSGLKNKCYYEVIKKKVIYKKHYNISNKKNKTINN